MTAKSRSKSVKSEDKTAGKVTYHMGHILYMAQLTGNIDKKTLINSMPEQDRDRYTLAFESLIKEGLLIQVKTRENQGNYFINIEKNEDAKELIHRFVRGTRNEIKIKPTPSNPFFHRGPIKSIEHFIGRYDELAHIFDRLRHTEDCSIIGPRAMGKTSLLHYISHKEVVRQHHLDPQKYIFIYYDLQRFGDNVTVKDFYYEMISKTISQINLGWQINEEEIKRINEESDNALNKINKSLFEIGDLERMIGALSERDYRIVYMFDEFETIANNPNFDFSFYGQLRALSGNPDFNVAYITASKKSMYDLTFVEEIKTSPFFRYFEDFRLGLMDIEEIRGFFSLAAKNGLIFSSRMRTLIEEWSGGHPFLAQLVCDYFFDLAIKKKKLKSGEEEKTLERFLKRHRKHFAYFWMQSNKKQQDCLWSMAFGKDLDPDSKGVIADLEESFLVVRNNENYRIFSSAYEKFIREMTSQ